MKLKSYYFPLMMVGMLFFVFGFLTWVNGILIPFFQICMDLSNFQATLVAFAAYFAYFVMALPSAYILKFTGYRKGIVLGLCIMAMGTLMFVPAAYSRAYIVFLTGLFITTSGLCLIQTAVNPYIAIIGPIESTAQRIGFMGIANKTAGIISLALLGKLFLFNADSLLASLSSLSESARSAALDAYALKIVNPYLIISAILLVVAVVVFFSGLPEIDETHRKKGDETITIIPKSGLFQYPYLLFGVLALFVSMATETIPIDGIILYSRTLGIPIEVARHFSTYTLYAMLLGYLAVTITVPRFISQSRAMQFASVWGLVFTFGAFMAPGMYSIYCVMLQGFGAAMFWGTTWGLSIRDLGIYTKKGSALLLMSVIGGGIFPVIFGKLLDIHLDNPRNALLLLIPCYLVLLFFGTWGYRFESWKMKSFAIFHPGAKNQAD